MRPAETVQSDQLESAGLTLVTSKEIAQVESTQQVNIRCIYESLAFAEHLLVALEIHIGIQSQTEHGGQVLTDANTELRSQ